VPMAVAISRDKLRIPPQSLEAEQALLGSIMLRPDAMYEFMDLIHPKSFYAEKHALIFETMLELFSKRDPIDLLSLSSRLKEKNILDSIGGASYLTELVNTVPSSANIKHYADIVSKKFMMRRLIDNLFHKLDLMNLTT
jgi:replicative DNA helicase